ncbi:MAG: 3-deoxy-manno-octulosonate cytidylyltransferase [Bacteroidales bacterium]|nr:3-deoxy-manno-octulosonate cytidylyltransferase [Bacteroidales bacterium]MCB8999175.1 3-deoxy-manno-octulosonate cytidylyltransferase [Bacteroidales bacterium]
MNLIGIIPARYASTRFPGKPLVKLGDKIIIRHVYEKAREALKIVYVATDDQRIFEAVTGFGGKAVMTSSSHRSGTDRCKEALDLAEEESNLKFDAVINIQGDEPFIQAKQIKQLAGLLEEADSQIVTLVKKITNGEDIFDPNKPKVVLDKMANALLFSRSAIPYLRGSKPEKWIEEGSFLKHIGIYGYRSQILREITRLEPSDIEIAESLEQLRWLSNGYKIKTALTEHESIGIDTPEDLEKALKML